MARKIRMAVAVHNENGESTWYMPGDVPTAEHAAQITNPKAWEDEAEPAADKAPKLARKSRAEEE